MRRRRRDRSRRGKRGTEEQGVMRKKGGRGGRNYKSSTGEVENDEVIITRTDMSITREASKAG